MYVHISLVTSYNKALNVFPVLLEERRAPDRFCVSNANMLKMREQAVKYSAHSF